MRNRIKLLLPCALLLSFAACDASSALPDPGSSLRKGLTYTYQAGISMELRAEVIPQDDDTGGGTGPLWEAILMNADRLFGAAFQGSHEAEAFCPEACVEAGGDWTGRVNARGEYGVEETELIALDDGTLVQQGIIYGEVSMGCECAEG